MTANIYKKSGLALLVTMTVITTVMGHSGKETHVFISNSESHTIVKVDVPWTINEAARQYFLIEEGDQISDQETNAYIQRYLEYHFALFEDKLALQPFKVVKVPQDHSHSLVFEMYYRKCNLTRLRIYNQLLIPFNENRQKNYIKVDLGGDQYVMAKTDADNAWLDVSSKTLSESAYAHFFTPFAGWLILFTLGCSYIFWRLKGLIL